MTDTSTTQPSVWADTALLTMLGALDRMVRDRQIPGGVIAAGTVETAPAHATSGVVSPGGAVAGHCTCVHAACGQCAELLVDGYRGRRCSRVRVAGAELTVRVLPPAQHHAIAA